MAEGARIPAGLMYLAKRLILKSFTHLVVFASRLTLACALFALAAQGLEFIEDIERYGLLHNALVVEKILEKPLTDMLRANLPCTVSGLDLAPYVVVVALVLLWIVFETERERLRALAWRLEEERKLARERAESERARAELLERQAALLREREQARLLAETRARLQAAESAAARAAQAAARAAAPPEPSPVRAEAGRLAEAGKPSEREHLLELYARTKKTLEEQKRNLSFLAVDVVDSTGMKQGEDPALTERDFRQYKKLVERVIAAHKGLKAAWTPDGVMICFASVQNAVSAAQDLLRGLEHFNRQVKTIKADFKIRCGINAGKVLFDDSVRMEEMTDRQIDIAGHMQKYAEVNTIYIGAHAIEGMRAQLGFRPVPKQIDGYDVCEWRADARGESENPREAVAAHPARRQV